MLWDTFQDNDEEKRKEWVAYTFFSKAKTN